MLLGVGRHDCDISCYMKLGLEYLMERVWDAMGLVRKPRSLGYVVPKVLSVHMSFWLARAMRARRHAKFFFKESSRQLNERQQELAWTRMP